MTKYKAFSEMIIRVYPEDYNAYIEIGEDSDGLGAVRLSVPQKHEDYFGKLDLRIQVALAEAVAFAILKKVEELKSRPESS